MDIESSKKKAKAISQLLRACIEETQDQDIRGDMESHLRRIFTEHLENRRHPLLQEALLHIMAAKNQPGNDAIALPRAIECLEVYADVPEDWILKELEQQKD